MQLHPLSPIPACYGGRGRRGGRRSFPRSTTVVPIGGGAVGKKGRKKKTFRAPPRRGPGSKRFKKKKGDHHRSPTTRAQPFFPPRKKKRRPREKKKKDDRCPLHLRNVPFNARKGGEEKKGRCELVFGREKKKRKKRKKEAAGRRPLTFVRKKGKKTNTAISDLFPPADGAEKGGERGEEAKRPCRQVHAGEYGKKRNLSGNAKGQLKGKKDGST